jgi:membrane-associated phospholipid phosphatase
MSKNTGNRILLIVYYLFLLSGLLFVFLVKKDVSFLLINNYHSGFLNISMQWISILGDGLFVVIFCVLLGLFRFRWFFLTIIPYLLSGILAQVLKRFVFSDMPRPLKYFNDKGIEIFTISGLDVHLNHSFPSGHTTSAFALFFVLAFLSNKLSYKLVFLFLAVLVGYSRIYLAQHFPVDALAGSLIGVLSVIISFPYIMGWKKRWLDNSFVSLIRKSNAD